MGLKELVGKSPAGPLARRAYHSVTASRDRAAAALKMRRLEAAVSLLQEQNRGEEDAAFSQTIVVDYPVVPRPRYGHGMPVHARLHDIINGGRDDYAALLTDFLAFKEEFAEIPLQSEVDLTTPYWHNGWLPALDAIALYALLAMNNPQHLFEIGSGNSTKFARRSIQRHGLRTKIISVDPSPRAECDVLCDEVVRLPLEQVGSDLFQRVCPGDIVFLDGSHRTFTNSDATTFFLEVMPALPDATLVQIHDIFLPADYPLAWSDRYYNEQYLLAAWLLAGGHDYTVVLPDQFVTMDPVLHSILDPIWSHPALLEVEKHGVSFWLRRTASSPMG